MVLLKDRLRSYNGTGNSQFTCYNCSRTSAVDYVTADYDIRNAVKQFDVIHKPLDSDHRYLIYIIDNVAIHKHTQIEINKQNIIPI